MGGLKKYVPVLGLRLESASPACAVGIKCQLNFNPAVLNPLVYMPWPWWHRLSFPSARSKTGNEIRFGNGGICSLCLFPPPPFFIVLLRCPIPAQKLIMSRVGRVQDGSAICGTIAKMKPNRIIQCLWLFCDYTPLGIFAGWGSRHFVPSDKQRRGKVFTNMSPFGMVRSIRHNTGRGLSGMVIEEK